ncbi:hypothetical protein BT69DRAFT_1328786 [Atractiella rhizophila]|nr:hypothetical protein BT69DRAFT_1328786 [Atractiella rhizophila]
MASTIKEDDLIEYTKLDILCHIEDTPNRRGGPPDLSKWKDVEIYADSIAGPKAELLQPEFPIGKGGMPYVLKGGCFCGKARYTIEMPTAEVVGQKKGELERSGWPDDCGRKVEGGNWFWTVSYCHCSQCRLSSSCPATPFLLIPSALFKLTVDGQDQPLSFPEPLAALSSYNSSTNPNKSPCFRHFCPACFTSLFDLSDSKTIDVYAGTLDDEYLAWVREERRIWLEDGSGGRVWRVFGKGLDDGLKWFEQNRLSNRIK